MAAQDSLIVGEEIAETTSTHGISILKEIFPEHGTEEKAIPAKEPTPGHLPLQQLLGSIPTPSRALASASAPQACTLTSTAPPAVSSVPVVPPPPPGAPPMLPAAACHTRHEQLELCRMMSPPLSEPTFTSYRERLRTSGRHAFQRAYDAGFLPKAMKQDAALASRIDSHYQPDMRTCTPMSTPMSYMSNGGHTPVSMHSNECWSMQMDPSSMAAAFPSQQMHMMAQQPDGRQMQQMQLPQMLPYPTMQQQPPAQPLMDAPSSHMSQMQVGMQMPQMQPQPMQMQQMQQLQQMQMPQMQAPQTHLQVATSGDATPTEIDRCMSIVMPGATQFPFDKDMMAAQLQATANCQCYED
jgi:hypothetical protein